MEKFIIIFNENVEIIIGAFIILFLYNLFFSKKDKNNIIDLNKLNSNVNQLVEHNKKLHNQVSQLTKNVKSQNERIKKKEEDLEKHLKYYQEQMEKDIEKKINQVGTYMSSNFLTEEQIKKLMTDFLTNQGSGGLDSRLEKIFTTNIKPKLEKFVELKLLDFNKNQNNEDTKIEKTEVKTQKKSYSNLKPKYI